MKRSFGKFVTIGLGMLCSVLLFVAGVLAVTTREMSFGIQVNVFSNILVQVDMSLDNGSTYTTIFNNAKTAVPTSSTVNSYATLTGNTVSLDTQNANSPFLNLNLKSQDSFIFKITNFTTSQYVSDATTYPNGPSLMATATATSIQGSIIKQYVYDQTTDPINGVQNIKPFTNGANASTAESKNLTLNFGVSQSALVRVNLDLTLKNYADKEITTQLENITSSNTYSFSRLTVDTYTTTLIPATNMALPAELEIYVGATLLTAGVDYVYNNSSGVLTINNTTATQTTGNISIKAKAKPQNVSVKYNLATGTTALLNTTTFTNGQTASVQVSSTQDFSTTIIAQGDKQIAYVVKVDGIALAKGVSFANGTLTVSNEVITGNLEIIASGVEVWDGVMPTANLSYTFSGGSGTELDPYQIATATDLAYLSSNVSGGTDYSLGVYYKQTADILLNNYFMSFDTASGLVLVKNASGGDVCCIGTGINGTIYNTSTAGTMGTIYTSAAATGTLSTTTAPADLYSWTAIGYDATGKYFKGTFDGNNYTISGMYINTTSGFQGLFGYSSGAKVQNVGVVNGYVKGAINVGGVVGNASTNAIIINCRNDGTVIGSSFRIGGIAGQMHTNSIINNCYNTGEITGDYDIGGIAGSNATTSIVSNCYNIGAISGTSSVGALVGTNASGCTISYSYYLDGTTAVGTQSGTISNLATFTNTTEAKSLLLNNLNTWVSTNNANGDYSPWVADTEVVNSGYPLLAEEWENVVDSAYAGGAGTSVDPYQIANADQLKYFANQVNIGTDYAQTYFILTGHILINNTSNLANWGTQAPSYSWSPIGNVNNPFNGVFDGNGFTVSGIYINNSSFSYSGLFGNVSGGTVLNVGVSASYIKGDAYVGGVVGMAKNSAKVANCYSNATVYGGQYVGGVAGYVNNSTVANCYFAGSLTGTYSQFGGVVGYLINASTLANCYNSGYVTNKSSLSTAKFGGVLGEKAITATVANCFWNANNSGFEASSLSTTGLDCSAFNAGSQIIEQLNTWVSNNITNIPFRGWYTNASVNNGNPLLAETIWNGTIATSFAGGTGTQNDPYLIENGSQLAYLASVTNNGTDATAGKYYKLTKPIMLNNYTQTFDTASGLVLVRDVGGVIRCCLGTGIAGTSVNTATAGTMGAIYTSAAATGTLTTGTLPADLRTWGPIGSSTVDKEFQGTFDGNNFAVSGVYINVTLSNRGLFGYGISSTINNTGVVNAYVKGVNYIAGILGGYGTSNSVDNCYNSGIICGTDYMGGVVGSNQTTSTVSNCYNTGTINGTGQSVGGVVGYNNATSTVTSSYNTGSVNGTGNNVGGVVGQNYSTSTVCNSYNTGTVSSIGSYVGGIVGYNRSASTVSNCYNIGDITGNVNSFGSIVGANSATGTNVVEYSYYLTGTTPFGAQNGTISNLSAFDASDQILNSAVTIGATTYDADTTSLLTALNAWVTENPTTNGITNLAWQIITGVNGGYPIFD